MISDYYNLYLKYKIKYVNLKNQHAAGKKKNKGKPKQPTMQKKTTEVIKQWREATNYKLEKIPDWIKRLSEDQINSLYLLIGSKNEFKKEIKKIERSAKKEEKQKKDDKILKEKKDEQKNIHYEIINLPDYLSEIIKKKILSSFRIFGSKKYKEIEEVSRTTDTRSSDYKKYHKINHFDIETQSGKDLRNLIISHSDHTITEDSYKEMEIYKILENLLNIQIGGKTDMRILLDISEKNCGLVVYYPDLKIKIPFYFKKIRDGIIPINIITIIPNKDINLSVLPTIQYAELLNQEIIGSDGIQIISELTKAESDAGPNRSRAPESVLAATPGLVAEPVRPIAAGPTTAKGIFLCWYTNKIEDLYVLANIRPKPKKQ